MPMSDPILPWTCKGLWKKVLSVQWVCDWAGVAGKRVQQVALALFQGGQDSGEGPKGQPEVEGKHFPEFCLA